MLKKKEEKEVFEDVDCEDCLENNNSDGQLQLLFKNPYFEECGV